MPISVNKSICPILATSPTDSITLSEKNRISDVKIIEAKSSDLNSTEYFTKEYSNLFTSLSASPSSNYRTNCIRPHSSNFVQYNDRNIALLNNLRRSASFRERTPQDGIVFSSNELEFKDIVGEGFFGRVFKVTKKNTGDVMAMKELKNEDQNSEKQFINEIEILRLLNHKCLLKYIGVILINTKINIILEYIAGGTLRKLIKDKSTVICPKIKSKIALDISSGMSYLHFLNIAHRDLTSKNCFLRNRQTYDIVVGDFGLAKVINWKDSLMVGNNKEQLEIVGSPYWTAPEILTGKHYELSVDVFSYGIILCELLGRISADPDYMPRLNNYGLDENKLREIIAGFSNPQYLLGLAINCCSVDPEIRLNIFVQNFKYPFPTIVQIIQIEMDKTI